MEGPLAAAGYYVMDNPRRFSIQIQFAREDDTCRRRLVEKVERIVQTSGGTVTGTLDQEEEGHKFSTINVQANDGGIFWQAAKSRLRDRRLPNMIVVCDGHHGWDDYLLLHHFRRDERLDDIRKLAVPAHL